MSLPTKTQVLVVGAGPNGLACAISLASFGLQVTIVDASPTFGTGSRAVGVHAHTLELLNTIGLAKPLMESGIHSRGSVVHGGNERLIQIDITQLHKETEFPLALLIPQHELENIFRERLSAEGIEILHNRSVVGLGEAPSEAGIEVLFNDGSVVYTRYVVGADGSRSTVRDVAGIAFNDPYTSVPYAAAQAPESILRLVLGDVYLEEPLPSSIPHDAVSLHLNNFLFLAPLRSKAYSDAGTKPASFWRIAMVIPADAPAPPKVPDIKYLQRELDARNPWKSPVKIASVITASKYRMRFAVASTFFKKIGTGNVLLVGDAAHVQSPVGGQGMNLGLCDAIVLGRAIRSHVDANSRPDSALVSDVALHEYASSRQRIAIKVIGMARQLTNVGILATGWRKYVRNAILRIAGSFPFVRRAIAWRMSGLSTRDA